MKLFRTQRVRRYKDKKPQSHSSVFLVPYGPWYEHAKSWWEMRKNPRVLFLFYEDMKEVRS